MAVKRFECTYFSRKDRFSSGIDLKESGCYASFLVAAHVVGYGERYRLTPHQH